MAIKVLFRLSAFICRRKPSALLLPSFRMATEHLPSYKADCPGRERISLTAPKSFIANQHPAAWPGTLSGKGGSMRTKRRNPKQLEVEQISA
jgi:hypothetical protein